MSRIENLPPTEALKDIIDDFDLLIDLGKEEPVIDQEFLTAITEMRNASKKLYDYLEKERKKNERPTI